jgi:competence protein ComEC
LLEELVIPVVTFFAVGKGNMTLLQFPNGINMLVDCNAVEGRARPFEYLRSKIRTLDFVVITHPHQDHITGLRDVCKYFQPKYLWHNGRYFKPDPVYDDWLFYEDLRGGKYSYCKPVCVHESQTATIGRTKLVVLGPKVPHLAGTGEDENNNSIVLKITDGLSSIVLTGDSQIEQWDVTELRALRGTGVFLASHHGRENGFSERVLRTVQAQLIVISDGECCDTDVTSKYQEFAPVRTTRNGSIVLQPQVQAAVPVAV